MLQPILDAFVKIGMLLLICLSCLMVWKWTKYPPSSTTIVGVEEACRFHNGTVEYGKDTATCHYGEAPKLYKLTKQK